MNIQNKIFQYIWKNKQEPIARKTIFLSKNLGGLNLLETQAHNIAMRIKHLLQLKQKEKNTILEFLVQMAKPKRILQKHPYLVGNRKTLF